MSVNPAVMGAQCANRGAMMPCRQCNPMGVQNQGVVSETASKPNKKGVMTTTLLLIGGAILGYGHRKYISQGLDKLKTVVSEFFSKGKPAELLSKGKDILSKAKDVIFVKTA